MSRFKFSHRNTLVTALLGIALSTPALAQTRYITDELRVPLRSGPGNQFRIIDAGLTSGTALTVIEANTNAEFSQVRLEDGREGYLRHQYLQPNQGAKQKLAALEKRYASLRQNSDEQSKTLNDLKQQLKKSERSEQQLSQKNAQLSQELERIKSVSAQSLTLADRNEELLKESLALKREKEALELETLRLEDNQSQRWYLYGAGTVLSGVFLGLLLPMLKRRRKQSEWV